MPNFQDILNHIIGAVLIIIVFSLAYAYLKPHRLHRTRKVSTLFLKVSYLAYVLVTSIVIYLAALVREGLDVVFADVEFYAFLLVLFVPTIGVFARKLGHFNKARDNYNYFFTLINLISIVAILLMYYL
jgi:hypothetical protein